MSEIDELLKAFEDFVRLPWKQSLAGPEKVWFLVYDPSQERRIRLRLGEFENITKKSGHLWLGLDLTDAFAQWMSQHKHRQAYFEEPELLNPALTAFTNALIVQVREVLTSPNVDENTVVAISGLASLFGLTKVSAVLEKAIPDLRGRLLIFFPGRYENSKYGLLGGPIDWNYLAVPITAQKWGVD